jgi:hypothetical protein
MPVKVTSSSSDISIYGQSYCTILTVNVIMGFNT